MLHCPSKGRLWGGLENNGLSLFEHGKATNDLSEGVRDSSGICQNSPFYNYVSL